MEALKGDVQRPPWPACPRECCWSCSGLHLCHWCRPLSAVYRGTLTPSPQPRGISGTLAQTAQVGPGGHLCQIQMRNKKTIPLGWILQSLWPALEILFENLQVETFYYMWWEQYDLTLFVLFVMATKGHRDVFQTKRWGPYCLHIFQLEMKEPNRWQKHIASSIIL